MTDADAARLRSNDPAPETLVGFWRDMKRIRRFEETALYHSTQGNVFGTLHLYIGEEASGVGVCGALRRDDYVASTHRGHGHCIAKGARMDKMMAELFGRSTGYCSGKGGSMHIADFSCGMLGANGIVGAGLGLAAGAALAARTAKTDRVAVAFFGDGAVSRGTFHEVINLAALWKLPVVFVCENNGYAQWVSIKENLSNPDVASYARNYAIPGVALDGNDVRAVYLAARDAVDRARRGEGPSLIECRTQRYYGHSLGDMQVYRTKEQVESLRKATDPIARLESDLVPAGVLSEARRREIDGAIEQEIKTAVEFALASPFPDDRDLLTEVTA
jgi:TPP-dependent pyruvate/acetoin dehydrogenase alpha subunit